MPLPEIEEEPITQEDAAQHLKISERSLDGLLAGPNPPPFYMLGARRRFFKSELNDWLKSQPETKAEA